jgi:hypothetical protein
VNHLPLTPVGIGDPHRSTRPFEQTGIPRLSPAPRIEGRAVENDPAIRHFDDDADSLAQIGIGAGQFIGHFDLLQVAKPKSNRGG